MSDYLANVRKYAPQADEAVVKKLVSHLGIALKKQDSSTVAVSDNSELQRIRTGFCTKKLSLSEDEASSAITAVCEQMKGNRRKCRVAFYYLLAEKSGQLSKLAA